MIWEIVSDDGASITERAAYGDGHFVRMTWRHRRDIGVAPMEGCALVYLPGPAPVLMTVSDEPLDPMEDEPDGEKEGEVEGESGGGDRVADAGQEVSGPGREAGTRVRGRKSDGSGR